MLRGEEVLMINRHILPLCVFVILLAFLWRGMAIDQQQLPAAMINKPIPKSIRQDFIGKVSLLHVWATWCGVCAQDQQLLSTLSKTTDFQVVGLNYKDLQTYADLSLNMQNDLYTVTIFDFTGSLGMDLGVYGTPTTFIVDRTGVIRFRHVGVLTNEVWSSQIIPTINKFS